MRSSVASSGNTCILILFISTILVAAFRHYWLESNDPFKCRTLLRQGKWLPAVPTLFSISSQRWQPPGCLLHEYTAKDIQLCLGSRSILFAGDSALRQTFWATARKLDSTRAKAEEAKTVRHENIVYDTEFGRLQFLWDPFLNSSDLWQVVESYSGPVEPANRIAAIVLGGGLWFARHLENGSPDRFEEVIGKLVSFDQDMWLENMPWYTSFEESSDQILIVPVEQPLYDRLTLDRAVDIMPQEINNMNEYLDVLSLKRRANVVSAFTRMTEGRSDAYTDSGLHVVDSVADDRANIILNLRCNAKLDRMLGAPFNRTCCSPYPHFTWVQLLALATFVVLLPYKVLRIFQTNRGLHISKAFNRTQTSVILMAAIGYCVLADRTHLFNKTPKVFDIKELLFLCGLSLIIGVLTVRRSYNHREIRLVTEPGASIDESTFLSRQQTEEWKGWMQLFILFYHYTGGSRNLRVYILVRLLVASYLFLTGYGHAMYFLSSADYSFKRVAAVLVRLNLLSCVLPYIMQTDYLDYYFAPLVSFWFMFVYFTLRFRRGHNQHLPFLIMKIMVAHFLCWLIHYDDRLTNIVFRSLARTCRTTWDSREWYFRVTLDIHVVCVGMFVAAVQASVASQPTSSTKFSIWGALRVVAAGLVISAYSYSAQWTETKYEYNWWHAKLAWLPVLSYVVLRNSNALFRSTHSTAFEWIGKRSLETFVLQFHIWLAADTKGLLSLGIWSHIGLARYERPLDFLVFTTIFLWLSNLVSNATNHITTLIIQSDGLEKPFSSIEGDEERRKSTELKLPVYASYGTRYIRSRGRGVLAWLKDLKVKIALMLITLWILNLTYR
ncbi:Cas1p-domain-containing protein [Rhizodiscina lignyota]|uniref:Cas1p-domain-containing protein n=1 Tax=Rhizodiscina lignyota TaxID=1504668 RepID=A0A9P4IRX7_9PEZI|nr:Cas1p-domain-containing protein [Rhizodiscina lignyota]